MSRIAIIGGGLAGKLLTLNLLRCASPERGVSVLVFDRGDERSMGPAYSDEGEYLLLNVPAGRMGALPEDPEHFVKWLQGRGRAAGPQDFLPRAVYREYILDVMREAVRTQGAHATLEHVRGEVMDVAVEGGRVAIQVHATDPFVADKAVLALGNFPPRHPPIRNRSTLGSRRYVQNPWDTRRLDALSPRDPVLLIGTGQTTVDLVVALHRRGHGGPIVAISRRGLLPLAHRGCDSYPSFFDELQHARRVLDIARVVQRHLARADAAGIDRRAVIDALRPDTQTLWSSLPEVEKRRFARHLVRYWEIIRSRIPPESEALIDAMRATGRLRIVAGRIEDLVDTERGIEVRYIPRGSTASEVETAAAVINCVGPESDYRRIDHPLVQNLLRRGLIRPGPAYLGLDARPYGAVIGDGGAVSPGLYTLGSPMKGVLWEVVAVPEIRVQAAQLARRLLDADPASRHQATSPAVGPA